MKLRILFLFLLIFIFFSCSPQSEFQLTPRQAESLRVVLVWPVEIAKEGQGEVIFLSPVRGIITGEVSQLAKETMENLLREGLERFAGKHTFVFLKAAEALLLQEKIRELGKTSPHEAIRFIGQETEATSILYCKVFRFRERKGRGVGVEAPASVAFALHLYDALTGTLLWYDVFDETQKPLSENLLNLSLYKSVKWLTAKELARNGLEKILNRSPLAK